MSRDYRTSITANDSCYGKTWMSDVVEASLTGDARRIVDAQLIQAGFAPHSHVYSQLAMYLGEHLTDIIRIKGSGYSDSTGNDTRSIRNSYMRMEAKIQDLFMQTNDSLILDEIPELAARCRNKVLSEIESAQQQDRKLKGDHSRNGHNLF